jgi:hypothetical protein
VRRTIANWFEARRLRTAVRSARPISIGDLAEATFGRIEGAIGDLGEVLVAPLTGRRCVYYAVTIAENLGPYGRNGAVVTVHRESLGVPFLVENDGHSAIIDPDGAQISARFDFETESFPSSLVDPRLIDAIRRLDYDMSMMRPLMFLEASLELGEAVTICGAGVREPDPDPRLAVGYREPARTRLRIRAAPKSPVIITDDPTTI